jgi:hypothetical protein
MARRVRGGSIGETGPFLGDSVGFVIDDRRGLLRGLCSSMTSMGVARRLRCGDGRRGDMASFLGESLGLVIDVLGLLRRNLPFSSITGKESMQGMRVWLLLLLRVRRPTTFGPNSNEMEGELIKELSEATSEVDDDFLLAPTPFIEIWFMLTDDFFDSVIILAFS